MERALQLQKAAVIAVADAQGELIALARMDGAPLSSIRVAANKAYTAARERKPTKEIGEKIRHPEKGFDIAFYGDRHFCGWGAVSPRSLKRGRSKWQSTASPTTKNSRLGAGTVESGLPVMNVPKTTQISSKDSSKK